MSGDARSAMLTRIRSAIGGAVADSAVVAQQRAVLPHDYDCSPQLAAEAKLALLEDRLHDYDAEVSRVFAGDVAASVASIIKRRGSGAMLVPMGFPEPWRPADLVITEDAGFTARELDRFDGVLTAATLAIAETGSLVLQSVPGQGRRAATLVPDFHLCVLRAEDVVETVPEAFARLSQTAALPTTFISGPSATADIEMTRIKGVHGPRFLHVVLVLDE